MYAIFLTLDCELVWTFTKVSISYIYDDRNENEIKIKMQFYK